MVAMGLIAISVLFVLGVLARFLSAQSSTAAQTAGKLLAKEVLDQAAAIGPGNWGFPDPTNLKGSRSLTLPNEDKPTEFFYELKPPLTLRSDPNDQGSLWELEAEVWWWAEVPTSRVERGNMSTTAHRVVYFEN